MGRRNQSAIVGAVIVASKLPWWFSILLAVISYFLFNHLAITHSQPLTGMKNIGQFAGNQLFLPLLWVGKIVVPLIFTVGAVVSLFNGLKRKRLYSSVLNAAPVKGNNNLGTIVSAFNQIEGIRLDYSGVDIVPVEINSNSNSQYDPIKNMTWQNFETLVSAFFREQGYTVIDRGGMGADGGIDILLKQNGKKIIVQCKHWKTYKVGVNIVREQFGIMTAEGFDEAIIVTSGNYTQEAKEFARNKHITLITGERLKEIIRKGIKLQLESKTKIVSSVPPNCPLCSSVMVERTARKGKWAGNTFWGCPNFPKCKGIVQK
jgi:restriction system protein